MTEQPQKLPLTAALLGFLVISPHKEDTYEIRTSNDVEMDEGGSNSVGALLVKDLVKSFKSYLDTRLWRNTRLSVSLSSQSNPLSRHSDSNRLILFSLPQLHLFVSLLPLGVISPASLRKLLSSFAAVLDEPGVPVARGDRAAICIIETLCRAGTDLLGGPEDEQGKEELDSLVAAVETYEKGRKVEVDLVKPWGGIAEESQEEDLLKEEVRIRKQLDTCQ